MNANLRKDQRQAYYAEAATWAGDVNGRLQSQVRLAWRVAVAAGVIALVEAVALAAMMPLKRTEPHVIVVDRNTGFVESAAGLKPGTLSQNTAVAQSAVVQYVLARETFDTADLKANYRKVQLMSAGEAKDQYLKEMSAQNPQSPVRLYPAATTVQAVVRSVSMLDPATAIVRFDQVRRDGGSATGVTRPYSAVVSFRFTGAPMRMGDRFENPLGFQVTRYRRDAESAGAVPLPAGLAEARP